MMRLGHLLAFVLCLGPASAAPDISSSETSPEPEAWIISPAEADLPLGRQLVSEKSDPDGPK